MAEAEKRMMEDDIISDNILLVGSAEFGSGEGLDIRDEFPGGGRARGTSHEKCVIG